MWSRSGGPFYLVYCSQTEEEKGPLSRGFVVRKKSKPDVGKKWGHHSTRLHHQSAQENTLLQYVCACIYILYLRLSLFSSKGTKKRVHCGQFSVSISPLHDLPCVCTRSNNPFDLVDRGAKKCISFSIAPDWVWHRGVNELSEICYQTSGHTGFIGECMQRFKG